MKSKIPGLKREDGSSLYRPFNFEHKIVRCTSPIAAWLPPTGRISFTYIDGAEGIFMPCRQCIWCRKQHARNWAIRCEHEARFHDVNCFITLTYSPEHLPVSVTGHPTLAKSHLQLFLKRLRKRLDSKDIKIRYFAAGEYGEKLSRPHYHAIIFGYDFPDKVLLQSGRRNAFPLYISEELSEVWGLGHCSIAGFCYESAAYVAGYCTKKIGGKKAKEHYDAREPEFCTMSKGRASYDPETGEYIPSGGLGYEFFENYTFDLYSHDCVVLRGGAKVSVPPYYDKLLQRSDPELYERVKTARRERYREGDGELPFSIDKSQLDRTESARIALFRNQLRKYENGH